MVDKHWIKPGHSWWKRVQIFPFTGIAIACIVLSLFQGLFYFYYSESSYSNIEIFLGIVNILLAVQYLRRGGYYSRVILLVLSLIQFELFILSYKGASPPSSLRLLQVGIITVYSATFVGYVLARMKILKPLDAFLLASLFSVVIFSLEAALEGEGQTKNIFSIADLEQSSTHEAHPELGYYFKPNTMGKSYYPRNPRGYFKENIFANEWDLYVHKGNDATLSFSTEQSPSIRIDIPKAETNKTWHIQLNQKGFSFKAGLPYVVRFQGRAEQQRPMVVAITQDYKPWGSVGGFYRTIELTPEWQPFQFDFVTKRSEGRARFTLEFGTNDSSVELAEIT